MMTQKERIRRSLASVSTNMGFTQSELARTLHIPAPSVRRIVQELRREQVLRVSSERRNAYWL